MPVTQKELAERLNVSQVTVSRALRGEDGVGEELRHTILAEADRLGYSIHASNHEARMMRQKACGHDPATNVICVVGERQTLEGQRSFNARIFQGICDAAEGAGLETLMAGHFAGDYPLVVSRGQVDGIICLLGDTDMAKSPGPSGVPAVSLFYDLPRADLVTVDNTRGAGHVAEHLCRLGHRRIAYIGPDTTPSRERLAGLRHAAARAGAEVPDELVRIRPYAVNIQPTRELVDELAGENGRPPFSALVAYNDYMAAVALDTLRDRGVRVPRQVSVAGFDGAQPKGLNSSRITTSAIPLEQLGSEAVRVLWWRIRNPEAARRRVVVETNLMVGDTTAAPRTREEALKET